MSNELKNTAQWINIPLDLGLVANVEQDVFATDVPFSGAIEANDLDYRSKLGSLKARKTDELELDIPVTYPIIKDYVQEGDGSGGEDPIGMLISTAPETFPSRLLVKGFKDLGGVAQGLLNPTKDGNPIADPNGAYSSTIQHDGKELRVHAREPKWYGIPRSVNELTYDFPVSNAGNTGDLLDTFANVYEPFGESNVLTPPSPAHFQVWLLEPIGIAYQNDDEQAMWGTTDPDVTGFARFNHAYWAVSYMYDGFQESNLTLISFPNSNTSLAKYIRSIGDTLLTAWTLPVELRIKNVVFSSFVGNDYITILQRPSKRIRKIRLYCAPAVTESSNPLKELQFYLVNDIDVATYDKKAELSKYNLPADRITGGHDGVRINVSTGLTPNFDAVNFVDGNTRFMVRGDANKEVFYVTSQNKYLVGDSDPNNWYIEFLINSSQNDALRDAFIRAGIDDSGTQGDTTDIGSKIGIIVFSAFRKSAVGDGNYYIRHRNYVGSEILLRSTYSQLSGISQTYQDSISPPRKGGYGDGSVQLIYGTTDKDGRTHEGRWQWSMLGTPDRFLPENQHNMKGSIVGIAKTGGHFVIFTSHSIKVGVYVGDALQWSLSDEKYGVGCLSRRTICETPIGLFFLSNEGVRILSGQLPSNPSQEFNLMPPISDAIFELFPTDKEVWKQAVAFYDSARRFYVLHFPTNDQRYNRFVYCCVKKEWNSESSESLYYGAGVGTDGYGRIGSSGSSRGLWTYRTSDSLKSSLAKYKIKFDANDPIHNKTIKRLIAQFEGEDTAITIACENQNSFQIGARTKSLATETLTDKIPVNIGLTDRAFDITCSKFESLKSLRLEVENHSTVSNAAIA